MIFQPIDPHLVVQKVLLKKLFKQKFQSQEKISISFVSKSFLQQQVRSMVGCLKFVGEGKWSIKKFKNVLKSKKRSLCAPPAPADGLFLKKNLFISFK